MAFYSLALVLNLKEIKKITNIKFSFVKFATMPILCSIAMGMFMVLMKRLFVDLLSARILTLFVVLSGGCIYLLLLVLTRVINIKEFSNSILKKRQVI